VRFRLTFISAAFVLALAASATASAYPWPIKPFKKQHPIRAYFGDPRTQFQNTLLTDGLRGPGLFLFHNGVDIAAPEGTPVYPVVSGTVRLIDESAVSVKTDDRRTFQYFHIVPTVVNGDHVVAQRTLIGYAMHAYNHVHLTEIRGYTVWNPLAAGGLGPYQDSTIPEVDAITLRPAGSLLPLDPAKICGRVSIVSAAHDIPPLPVPGAFAGFPVSPARVTWSLAKAGGPFFVPDVKVVDLRTTLPRATDFWNVYARGSFQNAPSFSARQYFMAGRFIYSLARAFDTRTYPNGEYIVTVSVTDMSGNSSDAQQRFRIENQLGTPTGCAPPLPAPPSSAP
jgi:murein DD-endopeptidase MepM/ murein hydrolase activator NlpD